MRLPVALSFVFVFLSTLSMMSQDLAELDRRNGFKSIKLGNPIDSVKDAVLKKDFLEKDEFPASRYETEHEDYKRIGEVAVKNISLMTYKKLVYKIVVTTDKDPRIMKALEKSYGKATYIVRTTSYTWNSKNLMLTFMAHKNSIELTYRCYPVIRMMAADKGRKLEKIADDF